MNAPLPTLSERAARARLRAASRRRVSVVEGDAAWVRDALLAALTPLLTRFARTSRFTGALDECRDMALRDGAKDLVEFRYFDPRLSGTVEERRAKIILIGAGAAQAMRDVVGEYCTSTEGRPHATRIESGDRTVHVAGFRMPGDRVMRHACYDSVVIDPITKMRQPAMKLLLRPLMPQPLILSPRLRIDLDLPL